MNSKPIDTGYKAWPRIEPVRDYGTSHPGSENPFRALFAFFGIVATVKTCAPRWEWYDHIRLWTTHGYLWNRLLYVSDHHRLWGTPSQAVVKIGTTNYDLLFSVHGAQHWKRGSDPTWVDIRIHQFRERPDRVNFHALRLSTGMHEVEKLSREEHLVKLCQREMTMDAIVFVRRIMDRWERRFYPREQQEKDWGL